MNWRDHITSAPEVLGGKPVICGTRLSVEFLLGPCAAGWSEAQILENYPTVTSSALRAVFAYAADTLAEDTLHYVRHQAD